MIRHANTLTLASILLLAASPAFAQDAATPPAESVPAPAPAVALPNVATNPPTVAPASTVPASSVVVAVPVANVGSPGFFPALPPSRPCEEADIVGLWKLQQVYENPIGPEMESFATQPYQFVNIKHSSVFAEYRSAYRERGAAILQKMDAQGGDVIQFVLNKGFLYLYKGGVPYDTAACFIVANRSDPFEIGQMLLMPPPDQTTVGRRVKVFQKVKRGGNGRGGKKAGKHKGGKHPRKNNQ